MAWNLHDHCLSPAPSEALSERARRIRFHLYPRRAKKCPRVRICCYDAKAPSFLIGRSSEIHLGVSKNRGTLFGGPYNKNPTI